MPTHASPSPIENANPSYICARIARLAAVSTDILFAMGAVISATPLPDEPTASATASCTNYARTVWNWEETHERLVGGRG